MSGAPPAPASSGQTIGARVGIPIERPRRYDDQIAARLRQRPMARG